ncbi:MAG: hypothetical protein E6K82_10740 [Candidatus Rokuibacteriota bacterium]|nr:MAG: hypothetical protein E6K82_10740 [Candidatus Rokubacteria bacterium]
MAGLGRLFVHQVNVAILGAIVVTVVACDAHHVSTLRELHRVRQELCAARLEVVASRHPYLKPVVTAGDKCAVLAVLTGEPPASTPQPRPSLDM